MARPSEDCPWRGYTQQNQAGRTRTVTEATPAQAARAEWPPSPDTTKDIQRLTRELRLCDVPRDAHKELQKILPSLDENENQAW